MAFSTIYEHTDSSSTLKRLLMLLSMQLVEPRPQSTSAFSVKAYNFELNAASRCRSTCVGSSTTNVGGYLTNESSRIARMVMCRSPCIMDLQPGALSTLTPPGIVHEKRREAKNVSRKTTKGDNKV